MSHYCICSNAVVWHDLIILFCVDIHILCKFMFTFDSITNFVDLICFWFSTDGSCSLCNHYCIHVKLWLCIKILILIVIDGKMDQKCIIWIWQRTENCVNVDFKWFVKNIKFIIFSEMLIESDKHSTLCLHCIPIFFIWKAKEWIKI